MMIYSIEFDLQSELSGLFEEKVMSLIPIHISDEKRRILESIYNRVTNSNYISDDESNN